MARLTFSNVSKLLQGKQARAREACLEAIAQFQPLNRVRPVGSVAPEDVFIVYEVDFDGAVIARDIDAHATKVTWLTDDGFLKPDFAGRWELVTQEEGARRLPANGRLSEQFLSTLGI